MALLRIGFVILIALLTLIAGSDSGEAGGGGTSPGRTVFDCPRPDGLGHSEVLVGFPILIDEGEDIKPVWARYCAFSITDPFGKLTYIKSSEFWWTADTRHSRAGQTTAFYEGEMVLLEDQGSLAYYGYWWETEKLLVSGPCFFMRAKSRGFVTGKAWINPPLKQIKGVPYCGNDLLPPPADFLLPIPLWFDMESARKKASCWEWAGTALIFPECIKLPEEAEKLHTTIKAPYSPIPPRPTLELSPREIMEKWCVEGYCNDPWRFLYPEENGRLDKTTVKITPGTGLVISLPPGVWATTYVTRSDGNVVQLAFIGPAVIYAEEGLIYLN